MMSRLMRWAAFVWVIGSCLCGPVPAQAAGKFIVLVAGTPSHGPGDHEFNAGMLLLKRCLDEVSGVRVKVHLNGWPKEETAFEGADAVVLFMDGGGGHPLIKKNRLARMGALMKRGVGLACLHYAVEVPKERGGPELLRWIGGYYERDYSINPHWTAAINRLPKHPITRGVKPFTILDEWYYHMRFPLGMRGVDAILKATPPDRTRGTPAAREHPGREEILAWATVRPDGGRGFGFTGAHFHRNWGNENFRKLVLNAILWIAQVKVPRKGVKSVLLPEELAMNLDPKGRAKPARVRNIALAKKIPGAIYRSGLVTPGVVKKVNINVANAKELWLVVADAGDGTQCDWADWARPRLIGPGGETRLTELKWESASAGWGRTGINKNVDGGRLRIEGKEIPYGIGTHAISAIRYAIAGKGFTRLKATVGLDNGGTDQDGCGPDSSVEFIVFTSKPPEGFLRMLGL